MLRREFVSQIMRHGMLGGSVAGLAGCGTLFHKERVGQPHSHRIDWCVAAANGLGLVLFFIPGVVAFAVDFYTGAIYLPCDECAANGRRAGAPAGEPGTIAAAGSDVVVVSDAVELTRIDQPREKLDPHSIENVVSTHVGRPVSLVESDARFSQLPQLDQFASQRRLHRANRGFGAAIRDLLTG
jgi:hypothetical protein